MQINLLTQPVPANLTVVPLLKSDALANTLATLANALNLPANALQADFKAEYHEFWPVYQSDGRRTWLLGLGESPTGTDWLRAFRKLFFSQKSRLPASVTVDGRGLDADTLEAVMLGIRAGGYDLRLYQTADRDPETLYGDDGQLTLLVDTDMPTAAETAHTRADVVAAATRQMLNLMNAPANRKSPELLGEWAKTSGQHHGYTVTVLTKSDLEAQGLTALLTVAQGSEVPPVLIVAEYKPTGIDNPKTVGLVGKGVTFDTGGISIKTSANMHYMKSDMGGAAAVLGTLEAAARLRLPVHLIGVIPATENSVDGRSAKPGDVVKTYTGKTIEIIDTDAEGRVILADGLGYLLRNYQPNVVIDLATLTGSVIATLGYAAAGLFTNNDELAAQLTAAADQTGERIWRLPLWDAYSDDLKSDVADVKNYSGKPIAGAITAAKFLEYFTDDHPAWAHLDIAGVAFADSEFGHQKNATGFGIRLLVKYLESL
jgi:leucyl aminopeptidase